jgi:hypothetical protein
LVMPAPIHLGHKINRRVSYAIFGDVLEQIDSSSRQSASARWRVEVKPAHGLAPK